MSANLVFENDADSYTPFHYAAKHGAINVLLGLVSRGAGIDPPDAY